MSQECCQEMGSGHRHSCADSPWGLGHWKGMGSGNLPFVLQRGQRGLSPLVGLHMSRVTGLDLETWAS